ncbi:MAG TPA: hypothetical protein ENI23_02525 [bacterium]|nr:hypothetical protein [bacterium]
MCKGIIRFFLGFFIVIFAFSVIALFTARTKLLNAEFYINVLSRNNVYQEALNASDKLLVQTAESSDSENSSLLSSALDSVKDQLLTEDLIRRTVENNLRNILEWLNGKEQKLLVYFPREDVLSALKETDALSSFEDNILDLSNTLPECTSDQIKGYEESGFDLTSEIECIPPGFDFEDRNLSELFSSIGEVTGTNPIDLFFETEPLSELTEETDVFTLLENLDGVEDSEGMKRSLEDARIYVGMFNLGIWIFAGITFLMFVLFVLIGGFKKFFPSYQLIAIPTGILSIVFGLVVIIPVKVGSNSLNIYANRIDPALETILEDFDFLPIFISDLVVSLFMPFVIVGGVLLVTGIISLIVQRIFFKKKEEAEEIPIDKKPKKKKS